MDGAGPLFLRRRPGVRSAFDRFVQMLIWKGNMLPWNEDSGGVSGQRDYRKRGRLSILAI